MPVGKKCECVAEYAMNGSPDRIQEFADEHCQLCDGTGIQVRQYGRCGDCGDDTCQHGGCGDHHCRNFCTRCQNEYEAEQEARYQRDVVGPLCGFDEEHGL